MASRLTAIRASERPRRQTPPRVASVEPGGLAERLGLRPGDTLIALNRRRLRDEIDIWFWAADGIETISWRTPGGHTVRRRLRGCTDAPLRMTLEPFRPDVCGNDCVFCFVYQNPRGMRRQVYFKDEDYRLSFIQGNYITGTSLRPADIRRIIAMRLSPLYFSVHATEPALRETLLGRRGLPGIMGLLRHLGRHGIQFHTQIVVCPGLNDGAAAERSVRDLLTLRPGLVSIAFVPVGLTDHRQGLHRITPVDRDIARDFIAFAKPLQREAERLAGEPVLFLSDEWFLRAETPLPSYARLPFVHQLENGVGMIWFFLRRWRRRRRRLVKPLPRPWRVAALTGPLAARGLADFWKELNAIPNLTVEPIVVENTVYGKATTVTGLLPGCDFQRAMRACAGRFDQVLIPGNALRETDQWFIDNLPFRDLAAEGAALGLHVDAVMEDAVEAWERIVVRCEQSDADR